MALLSYGVAFPSGPESPQVALHMTSLPGAIWGRARLHVRDPECTFVVEARETYYALSKVLVVVLSDTLLPQLFV